MSEHDQSEGMTLEERRKALTTVAADGIEPLWKEMREEEGGLDEFIGLLDYVLRAVCVELVAVSIEAEDDTAPALRACGAMLGGLFGIETTDDDETMRGLFEAGRRLRSRIGERVPA